MLSAGTTLWEVNIEKLTGKSSWTTLHSKLLNYQGAIPFTFPGLAADLPSAKKPFGTVTSLPFPTNVPFTKVPFKDVSLKMTVG